MNVSLRKAAPALFIALVLAGCGGDGGGDGGNGGGGGNGDLSADTVAERVSERIDSDVSCTETTEEGAELRAFECEGTYQGEEASIGVIEDEEGTLTATVLVGGGVADFFVLD